MWNYKGDAILDLLDRIRPSEEVYNGVIKAIKSVLKDNLEYGHAQANEIRKQIETTQKRLSKLLDLYTDGDIDKKTYDTKNNQWRNELDELLVAQTKINKTPVKYIENARDLLELSKNARDWYLQADIQKKRV